MVTGGTFTASTGTIQNLNAGTVTSVQGGTIGNLATGTITSVQGGTIQNVASGTFVQGAGTVTTGSLTNVANVGTVGNVNGGSFVQTAGTVTTQLAGTLTALANGTITAGTVRVNHRNTNIGSTFGTLGTANGSLFGTLVPASGAGTAIVVTGLSIVSVSGTPDVRILVGTAITGASVLAGGALVAGAGISMPIVPPHETATDKEITYHFVGAGTAFITLKYYNTV